MRILNSIKRKNPERENEEINTDVIGQVESKNKITVQECTYPSTSADNSVTKHDNGSPRKTDIPEC
jgi:hypothetical protein